MDASNILPALIIVALPICIFCYFCYKIGYNHGNRPLTLLFMNFTKNSTYEVLAFSIGRNSEHTMFLKNMDKYAAYPLAAISGQDLASTWKIGSIVTTNEAKELHCKQSP